MDDPFASNSGNGGGIPPPPPPPTDPFSQDPYASQGQASYGDYSAGGQQQVDPFYEPQASDGGSIMGGDPFGQAQAGFDPNAGGTYDPASGNYGGQPAAQDPYGAFDPMMGPPMAGDMGTPPSPPPPPKPSKPANFQLGALLPAVLKIKVPPHNLSFDEQYFLHLLAASISLTKDEKARIVESIPKLKQSQIDELVRIFEEERRKFAELGEEHVPQLEKLARQHYEDWVDIELGQEQQSKASSDAEQADEIRKQLGL